jgi:uncharacterized protein (TIGR02246 family)
VIARSQQTSITCHTVATPPRAPEGDLREAIDAFDRAFSEGGLEEFADLLAEDAHLLVHQEETMIGKEAIVAAFAQVFEGFDTSRYEPRYDVIDVHGDNGYVLGSFDETLAPREDGPSIRIRGRVVQFWRREGDGNWRIVRLLTSRSAPDEFEA